MVKAINAWDTPYKVSTGIGIVTYEEGDAVSLSNLLQHADEALYHAKSFGKNTFKFFNES